MSTQDTVKWLNSKGIDAKVCYTVEEFLEASKNKKHPTDLVLYGGS